MIKKKHLILFSFIIIFGILLDQIVKRLAVIYLKPIGTYPIIENVFHLTYKENRGAAFSILEGARGFLIALPIILSLVILFLVFTGRVRSLPGCYALIIVVAGGIGNVIDRIANGFVVDMFDFCLINFAIFNIADIFVTCGGIVFAFIYLFSKGEMFKWKLK